MVTLAKGTLGRQIPGFGAMGGGSSPQRTHLGE